jgi:sugar phosphate permease
MKKEINEAKDIDSKELQTLDEKGNLNDNKEEEDHGPIKLSRSVRFLLFLIIVSTELFMNNSSGLLSSSSVAIKNQFKIGDKDFGLLGTSQGIGRVVGNLLYIYFNNKISAKIILAFSLIVKGLLAIIFKFSNNFNILIFVRGIVAIFRMPPSIYCGVWIDQFGIQKYKTVQMSTIPMVQTAGKMLGYLYHMIVGEENWSNGFVIQGSFLILLGVLVICFPNIYFSQKIKSKEKTEENKDDTSEYEYIERNKDVNDTKKKSKLTQFFHDVYELISNPIWSLSMTGRALLFGITTTIHFWVSDYMKNVILIKDKKEVFMIYTVITILGPLGGVICNSLVNPLIGGYEKKKASYAAILLHITEVLCGMSMAFLRNKISFLVLTLFYFLFDSSVIGIINGINISSVRPEIKATGFSIANLVTHALCSGPGPYLYGVVNDKYKDRFMGAGMLCMMFICALACPIFIIMTIIRNRILNTKEKEKAEKLINKDNEEGKN